jgi:TFIIF-interacting CTD phosphatase-like protein
MFGAHVFSQVLFCCGVDQKRIEAILDNSAFKIGKRLYGTNLIVQSPNIVKDLGECRVVLPPSVYSDEIKSQLKSINQDVRFID